MVYQVKRGQPPKAADPDETYRQPDVPRALRGSLPKDATAMDRCAAVIADLELLSQADRVAPLARVNRILADGDITLARLRQVERVVRQELRLRGLGKGKPRGRPAHQTKALQSLSDLVHKPWKAGLSILAIHAIVETLRPGTTLEDVRKVVATLNSQDVAWNVGSEDEVDT